MSAVTPINKRGCGRFVRFVPPKTAPKPVTTKHLAYELAEQHKLTKKRGLEIMEELVGMISKHLKKGERVKIAGHLDAKSFHGFQADKARSRAESPDQGSGTNSTGNVFMSSGIAT